MGPDDKLEQVIQVYRVRFGNDAAIDDIISELRSLGLSKIRSIQALAALRLLSLADAKVRVHSSPTWNDVKHDREAFADALANGVNSVQDEEGQ